MQALARSGLVGGGEGVDLSFAPDMRLADGAQISGSGWQLTALHTPGHIANHLCFALAGAGLPRAVFTGDHVMGWASSMVSPPDGDLTAFMASCARLAARDDAVYFPGHGDPVEDPQARLAWLIAHREARSAQIRAALAEAPGTPEDLTARVYTDTPEALRPAATRNLLASLIALVETGEAKAEPRLSADARFSLR